MTELRLATRASALALAQARMVAAGLESVHPGLSVRLVEVATTGDLDTVTSVVALTEMGAFVRAVQTAILTGEADLAVHSAKDLPTAGPEGLTSFYPPRGPVADVICGSSLDRLPTGARVGTGSPRRVSQLRLLRPDLEVTDIRGNVGTRLGKIGRGFEAVVLAEAGLVRLGREAAIAQRLGADAMVPAPAQGALAVEVLADSPVADLVRVLDHPPTRLAVEAERGLLAMSGAGCRSALGALAVPDDDQIRMVGFVDDWQGPRRATTTGRSPAEVAAGMMKALGL